MDQKNVRYKTFGLKIEQCWALREYVLGMGRHTPEVFAEL